MAKYISYALALSRAQEKNNPSDSRLIAAAIAGAPAARRYLRSEFTTGPEYDQLNPQSEQYIDEDGPCAGFGCEATIIY